jgi:hypothetical protein
MLTYNIISCILAHIAQQVEHHLGKMGVTSSNLVVGFEIKGG